MFLSMLNDKEKELFLNLVVNAAEADGVVSNLEKTQIQAYCNEMNVKLKDRKKYTLSTDEILQEFSKSDEIIKRAVFAEIIALLLVDGMTKEEEILLDKIKENFGFDDKYKNEIISWYNKLLPLYKKGFELIGIKFI